MLSEKNLFIRFYKGMMNRSIDSVDAVNMTATYSADEMTRAILDNDNESAIRYAQMYQEFRNWYKDTVLNV